MSINFVPLNCELDYLSYIINILLHLYKIQNFIKKKPFFQAFSESSKIALFFYYQRNNQVRKNGDTNQKKKS